MDSAARAVLHNNKAMIKENMLIIGQLLDQLQQEDILSEEMVHDILAKPTVHQQIDKLLFVLTRRGSQAFGSFISALRKDFNFLAIRLQEAYDRELQQTNQGTKNTERNDKSVCDIATSPINFLPAIQFSFLNTSTPSNNQQSHSHQSNFSSNKFDQSHYRVSTNHQRCHSSQSNHSSHKIDQLDTRTTADHPRSHSSQSDHSSHKIDQLDHSLVKYNKLNSKPDRSDSRQTNHSVYSTCPSESESEVSRVHYRQLAELQTKLLQHLVHRNHRELTFCSPKPVTFQTVQQLVQELIDNMDECYSVLKIESKVSLTTFFIEIKKKNQILEEKVKTMEKERQQQTDSVIQFKVECSKIKKELDKQLKRVEKLEHKEKQLLENLKDSKADLEVSQKNYKEIERLGEQLTVQLTDKTNAINTLEEASGQLKDENSKLQEKITELEAENNRLKNEIDNIKLSNKNVNFLRSHQLHRAGGYDRNGNKLISSQMAVNHDTAGTKQLREQRSNWKLDQPERGNDEGHQRMGPQLEAQQPCKNQKTYPKPRRNQRDRQRIEEHKREMQLTEERSKVFLSVCGKKTCF